MKKLLFAVIMLLLSTEFALAAPKPKPMQCGGFDQVIEFLEGLDYKPVMGANGKDADRIAIWIRGDGFVVVENYGDKKLCIKAMAEGELRTDKEGLLELLGYAKGATNAVDRPFESP